jgi:hypothetical protein
LVFHRYTAIMPTILLATTISSQVSWLKSPMATDRGPKLYSIGFLAVDLKLSSHVGTKQHKNNEIMTDQLLRFNYPCWIVSNRHNSNNILFKIVRLLQSDLDEYQYFQ